MVSASGVWGGVPQLFFFFFCTVSARAELLSASTVSLLANQDNIFFWHCRL